MAGDTRDVARLPAHAGAVLRPGAVRPHEAELPGVHDVVRVRAGAGGWAQPRADDGDPDDNRVRLCKFTSRTKHRPGWSSVARCTFDAGMFTFSIWMKKPKKNGDSGKNVQAVTQDQDYDSIKIQKDNEGFWTPF